MFKHALEYTAFGLRIAPKVGYKFCGSDLILPVLANTIWQAAAVYGAIRLVMTAVAHGSFF